jgi:membrane protein YdbS with pleckstrin-like domain
VILREPALQLDPRVRTLWTLEWTLGGLLVAGLTGATAGLLWLGDEGRAGVVAAVAGGALTALLAVAAVVQPRLAYRRFRYEITELGLYVARGRLWRTWQIVPHARVQTVDTKSGPFERALGLVSVAVTTASSDGGTAVPGLDRHVADALVTELARRAGIEEGT